MLPQITEWSKKSYSKLTKHWDVPRPGEYVSNKEFAYFCLGASGATMLQGVLSYVSFAASCFLVGTIYNIAFKDIYLIGLLAIPMMYLVEPINMFIFDNLGQLDQKTERKIHLVSLILLVMGISLYFVPQRLTEQIMSAFPQIIANLIVIGVLNVNYRLLVLKKLSPRFGKYKPWIIAGSIPALLIIILLVYLPFGEMAYPTRLWVLHLMFSLYSIFDAFIAQKDNLHKVISPNSHERVRLMGLGSYFYSAMLLLFTTIYPVLAVYTGGQTSITTYRVFIPIFYIIGVAATMVLVFKVKERVLIEKDHKPQISMKKGFKEVLRNKYFWITNLAAMGNMIASGSITLVNVMFVYAIRQEWMLGVYALVITFAYDPGLIFCHVFIKWFGKRNMMLIIKGMGIIGLVGIYFAMKFESPWLFIGANFLSILFTAPLAPVQAGIDADIWDYQQYKSGERLDGCAGIFSLIMTPINRFVGGIIPLVYATIGFTTDWDILYVDSIRNQIVSVTILVSGLALLLSAIPFLFYDLSEKRHGEIVEELKDRMTIE